MRYTIDRREGLTRDDTPERIQAWLRANGHPDAEVISTGYNPDNGNLRIRVEAASDPEAAIANYTPTPTPREVFKANAIADGRAVIRAIAQKPRADRTPVERALLGLAVMLSEIDDGTV
jgi:hypothetical protein